MKNNNAFSEGYSCSTVNTNYDDPVTPSNPSVIGTLDIVMDNMKHAQFVAERIRDTVNFNSRKLDEKEPDRIPPQDMIHHSGEMLEIIVKINSTLKDIADNLGVSIG